MTAVGAERTTNNCAEPEGGAGYRGYQERYIAPFLLNGYPCFAIGISFAGAAPCVVPGLDREGIFFWVMETVLRPPSVSVLRSIFFL